MMDIRDVFAFEMFRVMVSGKSYEDAEGVAKTCYAYADAMIAERAKKFPGLADFNCIPEKPVEKK